VGEVGPLNAEELGEERGVGVDECGEVDV